jgi:hypothetical protein
MPPHCILPPYLAPPYLPPPYLPPQYLPPQYLPPYLSGLHVRSSRLARSPMRWCSLQFVMLGLLLACGDGGGPEDHICTAPLQVFASNSVTPTVSWADGCRVNEVVIRTTGPLIGIVWSASYPSGSNPMVPPLVYGVLPDGAQGFPDNPEPLQPGVSYAIDVSISDIAQGGENVRVGTTNLTVVLPD